MPQSARPTLAASLVRTTEHPAAPLMHSKGAAVRLLRPEGDSVLFEKGAAHAAHFRQGRRPPRSVEVTGRVQLDVHIHGIDMSALAKLLAAIPRV